MSALTCLGNLKPDVRKHACIVYILAAHAHAGPAATLVSAATLASTTAKSNKATAEKFDSMASGAAVASVYSFRP